MTGVTLVGATRFRVSEPGSVERRLVDAVEACVCRWGVAKTTVEDVAREAGVSRATVYRAFPGGRAALLEAHRRHRVADFFGRLEAATAHRDDLADLLGAVVVEATAMLRDDEGFRRRRRDEPGEVLAELSFRGLDRIFAASRVFFGPHLEPHLGSRLAGRVAEWLARLVLASALDPRRDFDLSDPEAARRLVDQRILPALREPGPTPGVTHP